MPFKAFFFSLALTAASVGSVLATGEGLGSL